MFTIDKIFDNYKTIKNEEESNIFIKICNKHIMNYNINQTLWIQKENCNIYFIGEYNEILLQKIHEKINNIFFLIEEIYICKNLQYLSLQFLSQVDFIDDNIIDKILHKLHIYNNIIVCSFLSNINYFSEILQQNNFKLKRQTFTAKNKYTIYNSFISKLEKKDDLNKTIDETDKKHWAYILNINEDDDDLKLKETIFKLDNIKITVGEIYNLIKCNNLIIL